MSNLSPFTRKLLAVGLLFLAVLSTINLLVVPVLLWQRTSIERLRDARFERTSLEAALARPDPPPIPALARGTVMQAFSAGDAKRQLAAVLSQVAAANGVHITGLNVDATTPAGQIVADLSATAPELAMVGFFTALERGAPLIRFRQWRLQRSDSASDLLFSGQAAAVWARP